MKHPQIEYVRGGDGGFIAYQVCGDGPVDLVLLGDYGTPLDARWDLPILASTLERLSSFARVITFDRRGVGCSDPYPIGVGSSIEAEMEDVRAVMNAVSSARAAIVGTDYGGACAILFAATYPERTSHLVLVNTTARTRWAEDYPMGWLDGNVDSVLEGLGARPFRGDFWQSQAHEMFGDNEQLIDWSRRYWPLQISPSVAAAYVRVIAEVDVRDVLGSIRTPTLVLHRLENEMWMVSHGRYLGEHIPDVRYVELPGRAGIWWAEDPDRVTDEIEEFLTGTRGAIATDRALATVLFTDVVASTETAAKLGDRKWRELLDAHDALVRRELEKHRGRLLETSGDSLLATFDGPARAIRCARAITNAVSEIGVELRAGLHTGEVELRGDGIAGISVNLAHRVMELAGPHEVLVSRTVVDLVAGSGIEFADRGTHVLKGVPGAWQLYEVVSH